MTLLSGIEDAIIVDDKGIIRACGTYFQSLAGLNQKEILGQSIHNVFPQLHLLELAQKGKPTLVSWSLNGEPQIMSSYPIWIEGQLLGVLGVNLVRNQSQAEVLIRSVKRAFPGVLNQHQDSKNTMGAKYSLATIIGESEGVIEAKERVKMIAESNVPVLIQGDTGTGKELIAHALHQESGRKNNPFVRVNCAGIPDNLLESELFGYDEGAFTGARRGGKPGKFELANQGSIFLDEIGELSLAAQAKLLRILQENEIERVGSTTLITMNTRVISATNRPLTQLVEEGKFRKDLMFRLAVFSIYIPPLKSRTEDIPLLCRHFINQYNLENGTNITGLSKDALEFLVDYHWPGNVRELYITIERACLDAQEGMLTVSNILRYLGVGKGQYLKNYSYPGFNLKAACHVTEKAIIHRALLASDNNRVQAAKLLGISRSALYKKLAELGIE